MKYPIRVRLLFIICLIASVLLSLVPVTAQIPNQVLILDIPRFDLAEIAAPESGQMFPNLVKLAETSSVGLMSSALADPLTTDRLYLSINSGNQLKSPEGSYIVYNATEEVKRQTVGDLYRNLTGIEVPKWSAVNLQLPLIEQANDTAIRYSLGLLGKLAHKNGLQTAVIGNADTNVPNRDGAAMIMDENGLIDWGALGPETVMNDPGFPFGRRTDPAKILSYWNDFRSKAQIILITCGDFQRLERYGEYLNKTRWNFYRKDVLRNYDQLVGRLLDEIDFQHTLLIVFTALPPGRDQTPGSRLSPVFVKGPGFSSGLLYSGSTRKKGILTSYDLPVTMLGFLHINTRGLYNGVMLHENRGNWRDIPELQRGLAKNYDFRWPLLTGYGYLLLGLFFLIVAGLIFGFGPKVIRGLEYGYLFLLTIPAVFLIEALINPLDWFSVAGWTFGLAGLVFGGAYFCSGRKLLGTLGLISAFTLVVIIIDIFCNGYLELRSFWGYSAVAGARFYGIGNEYLGFLFGAYIVTVSVNYEWILAWKISRFRVHWLWLPLVLITMFIIHPNLGAKIGGGITALIGLSITTYLWLGRPVRFREIMGLGAALVIMLALFGSWDFYMNRNSTTHFGQLLALIKHSGFNSFIEIISRKLQLNLRLIDYSGWTKVLIGVLLVIPILYKKPSSAVAGLMEKYPGITRGFLGLSITALIGLLANDSGIVTAATIYIFGAIMLISVIHEHFSANKEEG
jgi:hypothetical protein